MSANENQKGRIPLFCKPVSINYSDQLLYNYYSSELNAEISFRSLQLETDIDFLHIWVNKSYSRRFWQLNCTKSVLHETYRQLLANENAHSFIGIYNESPVCQLDLYNVSADELNTHIEYENDDCGLHLLMLPPDKMIKGISELMLYHFIRFYFSFPQASRLFAEPDKDNVLANRLALKTSFTFLKEIKMSCKNANLYLITKEQFNEKNSIA